MNKIPYISIHPPREGWDLPELVLGAALAISIHPPREGWDYIAALLHEQPAISIHPPREGWDSPPHGGSESASISIHPPREGWDLLEFRPFLISVSFQSTHPVRGGTKAYSQGRYICLFQSTHPVRGGTRNPWRSPSGPSNFNPPTP